MYRSALLHVNFTIEPARLDQMSKAPLTSYDDALNQIFAHVPSLKVKRVVFTEALGMVLRESIVCDRDQPPFNRSTMDGLAVRSADLTTHDKLWPICGSIAAGDVAAASTGPMPTQSVMHIATGAPMPDGADAVVPIEQVTVTGEDTVQQAKFNVCSIDAGQNVHHRGADAKAGAIALSAGTTLSPHHVGIAASVGAATLKVTARPRVTLLTSGDEVRPPHTHTKLLKPQQIRNSNGPMVAALLQCLGAELLAQVHVADQADQTLAAAHQALCNSDLILTTGGVSAGQRDWLPWAWQQLGLQTILHGVAIQPGKPLLAARTTDRIDNRLVLGLPGNPVSVLATMHLFIWPVLRRMVHPSSPPLPWRHATLAEPVDTHLSREVFRTAQWLDGNVAKVVPWQGSGDLMHSVAADGFVRLPKWKKTVDAGSTVAFLRFIG